MATEAKGFFLPDVVNEYLHEKGNKYSSDEVRYFYSSEVAGSRKAQQVVVPKDGNAGSVSPPALGTCLCMDVGCWTGDGPKSDVSHERHRDFGVVCGNVAVLCQFPADAKRMGKAEFKDDKKEENFRLANGAFYDARIKPFLDYLSSGKLPGAGGSGGKGPLGDVLVVNAMSVGPVPEDETIHVFLGDLHLPIISEKDKTYVPSMKGRGEMVPRVGRLDLGTDAMERFVEAMSGGKGGTGESGGAKRMPLPMGIAMYEQGNMMMGVAVDTLLHETLDGWEPYQTDGWVSRKEAGEWADYYIGKGGKKGAEIFQGSAADLVAFLGLLEGWRGPKLHLVQTGDMMDFWIGLKRGFENAKDGNGVRLRPGAREFVTYWWNQTVTAEKTANGRVGGGRAAGKLLKLRETEGGNLRTFILYGNHDNYLRSCRGLSAWYSPSRGVVYAEHGHQSDGFNSDEDAEAGWALTQAAFLLPKVRDWEDPASAWATGSGRQLGAVNKMLSKGTPVVPLLFTGMDPGARLQRIARGADVCLAQKKSIYVLGHTHQAQLKKVVVSVATEAVAREYELRQREDLGRALVETAGLAGDALAEAAKTEGKRAKGWAEAFAAERLREAKRDVARSLEELRKAKSASVAAGQEAIAAAERKLEEARRQLDEVVRATDDYGRRKLAEAQRAVEEAREELRRAERTVMAEAQWTLLQAQRKALDAKRELEGLGEKSEAYAQKKVKAARRMLDEERGRVARALERAHRNLAKAQSRAERWTTKAIQEAKQKAAELQKELEKALSEWTGGGGRSRGHGATGSW